MACSDLQVVSWPQHLQGDPSGRLAVVQWPPPPKHALKVGRRYRLARGPIPELVRHVGKLRLSNPNAMRFLSALLACASRKDLSLPLDQDTPLPPKLCSRREGLRSWRPLPEHDLEDAGGLLPSKPWPVPNRATARSTSQRRSSPRDQWRQGDRL